LAVAAKAQLETVAQHHQSLTLAVAVLVVQIRAAHIQLLERQGFCWLGTRLTTMLQLQPQAAQAFMWSVATGTTSLQAQVQLPSKGVKWHTLQN
jgi:hypothetical protein